MNNELKLKESMPLASTNVVQTGEHSVYLNNENGGVVNFNIQLPQNSGGTTAEQMMTIQSFRKDYYQLIVTCEEDVFATNVITVSADRALTSHIVPPEIYEACSSLTDDGIEILKTIPAIICQENTSMKGTTDPKQYAVYGYIKKVQKAKRNIKIVFQPIMPFSQLLLCDKKNAVYFDLNMNCAITDLNRSCWSVHKVNLFEAFDVAGLQHLPRPY